MNPEESVNQKYRSNQLTLLLQWCEENKIYIHPSLELRFTEETDSAHEPTVPLVAYSDDEDSDDDEATSSYRETRKNDASSAGLAVYASHEIPADIPVVKIPPSAVLSIRNASLTELHGDTIYTPAEGLAGTDIDRLIWMIEKDDNLSLAFALLFEIVLGKLSAWYGYIQSLPRDCIPLAILWRANAAVLGGDWKRISHIIRGTELEHYLNTKEIVNREEAIRKYYEIVVDTNWPPDVRRPELIEYQRAYALVSSRAFMVDAYHGLAMVPIADAFNHVEENHVQLESDWNVCTTCGSLNACEHDVQTRLALDGGSVEPKIEHSFDMVTNTVVDAGCEVFNTYDYVDDPDDIGSKLNNVKLMTWYGFCLEGSSREVISVAASTTFADISTIPQQLVTSFKESELISTSTHGLNGVDAEGKIGIGVWTTLATAILGVCHDAERIVTLSRMQILLEEVSALIESEGDKDNLGLKELQDEHGTELAVLISMAEKIAALCDEKLQAMVNPSTLLPSMTLSFANPSSRGSMKMAIRYTSNEWAILAGCRLKWMEFGNFIRTLITTV